ncbi:MAG: MarP family serine protease [Rhodoglobus sp.]
MNLALILDLLLIVMLLGYVAYGIRIGFTKSVLVGAGTVAGIFASIPLAPALASMVPLPQFRVAITIAVAFGLIGLGHALGAAIARALLKNLRRGKLRGIDRAGGGIAIGVLAALVVSTVSLSVSQIGSPVLSRTIAESTVISTIQNLTPDPVEAKFAQWRTMLAGTGESFFNSGVAVAGAQIPSVDTDSAELAAAAQSVVRITGNAYSCGRAQTGTGFVVSKDRIVTNAHVLAGIEEPVIEALNGQVLTGTIVYFDAVDDLAIIAVPGLNANALPVGITAASGASTAIEGYPYGGPITVNAALVQQVSTTISPDIYGAGGSPREVYTLTGQVHPGNSGGPLLNLQGQIVGAVFARSADMDNIGYAVTLTELQPVVDSAPLLTTTVSSGACISR